MTCSFKFCPQNKDRTVDVFKIAVLLRKFGISPLTSIQKFGSAFNRRNAWKLCGLSKWGHQEQRNRPRVGHLYILNLWLGWASATNNVCMRRRLEWDKQDFNFKIDIFGKSFHTKQAWSNFVWRNENNWFTMGNREIYGKFSLNI